MPHLSLSPGSTLASELFSLLLFFPHILFSVNQPVRRDCVAPSHKPWWILNCFLPWLGNNQAPVSNTGLLCFLPLVTGPLPPWPSPVYVQAASSAPNALSPHHYLACSLSSLRAQLMSPPEMPSLNTLPSEKSTFILCFKLAFVAESNEEEMPKYCLVNY
jgi:hypothetical protein